MMARSVAMLLRSGVVRPMRPDRLVGTLGSLARFGLTPAAAFAVGAARHPRRPALVDDRGTLSFAELHWRVGRIATALADRGIGVDRRVGLLCRNHRGPVEVLAACARLGADVVLLNTGLSRGQLAAVLVEQGVDLVVADQEFLDVLDAPRDCQVALAWVDGDPGGIETVESWVSAGGTSRLPVKPVHGRLIVLTSGTTGTPKGARRPALKGLGPAASILSRIPVRYGEPALLSAPLFHTWGFAGFQIAILHGHTLVLQRRFDPAEALAAIVGHRVTTMFAVPVMLQRMLELPAEELAAADTSDLRIIAASGSAVSATLARRAREAFGPVLYNLYGSTEVSWATIATPEDMQASPGTVGTAPPGTVLRILDEAGREVTPGVEGRIFVGNDLMFEGYTREGADTETIDGLIGTGDIGRVDEHGRLHVTGRSDDMIVSGGENVHPGRVEELIGGWHEVAEVAVTGVDDEEYGQRLAAYLVLVDGASLDADAVRSRVRSDLARFAVPREVVFLDELPRNPTGKVDKRKLPSPA